jgi:hypothetical protein
MKMIKTKQWSIIAMMAVILMGLAACSSDDEEEVGSKADLIGTWEEYAETYWEKEDGKIVEEYELTKDDFSDFGWRWSFYEDGSCNNQEYWSGRWDNSWGTWSMQSNTIYIDGEEWFTIKTLNKNTLIVEYHEKEVSSGVTYEYYSLEKYHRVSDED